MNSEARQPGRSRTKAEAGTKAVAAYLAKLPKEARVELGKLRKDIRAAAPDAEELIAWSMPAFRQGKLLVGYAAFKDHYSLFPMSLAVMRRYEAEISKYVTTKGSIHFTAENPLPSAFVKKLVRARIAENEAKPGRP